MIAAAALCVAFIIGSLELLQWGALLLNGLMTVVVTAVVVMLPMLSLMWQLSASTAPDAATNQGLRVVSLFYQDFIHALFAVSRY
ncbi:hypothetical protein COO60DRAFT_1498625 [Scenedesmus sp. NREL 46B-D3]|nr:hypothetical protein COO60DRAFT_1498625 [Scenedesmus sp. NREL 46B-D3]